MIRKSYLKGCWNVIELQFMSRQKVGLLHLYSDLTLVSLLLKWSSDKFVNMVEIHKNSIFCLSKLTKTEFVFLKCQKYTFLALLGGWKSPKV